MEIKTCSNCLVEVMPTTDGCCPSCRRPLTLSSESQDDAGSSRPPIVMDTSRLAGADTPFDSANPYQAPPTCSLADDRYDEYSVPQDQGFLWLLFLLRGRIGRRAFWGYSLLVMFFYYAAAVMIGLIVAIVDIEVAETPTFGPPIIGLLLLPVAILVFWMIVAIQVKRWHDHGLSGWWWFIELIPVIGPLAVFVQLGCLRGTIGPNRYGPDPT